MCDGFFTYPSVVDNGIASRPSQQRYVTFYKHNHVCINFWRLIQWNNPVNMQCLDLLAKYLAGDISMVLLMWLTIYLHYLKMTDSI